MAAAKQITLQAKNTIINGTGQHKPGEVFKCSPTEASFLIKKGAAIKIGKDGEKVLPDTKEKKDAVKLSKKEQEKADKLKKKQAAEKEARRKQAEKEAADYVKNG